jgi:RNA polymerase sigma-70 factor (ECF subfamily)
MDRQRGTMQTSRTASTAAQPDEAEDAVLVKEAAAGSHGAFEKLVQRHKVSVTSFALALTGSFRSSEEIAHDSFVIAWKELAEVGRPDRFRGWVCGIAKNLARRRGQELGASSARVSEIDPPSLAPSPLDQMISREEEAFLERALARIPKAYRLPLVLFYREGKSIEKVAAVLEINTNTAKQRLYRGRKMLQKNVADFVEAVLERDWLRKDFTAAVLAAIVALATGQAHATPSRATHGTARMSGKGLLFAGVVGLGLVGLVISVIRVNRSRATASAHGASSTRAERPPGQRGLETPSSEFRTRASVVPPGSAMPSGPGNDPVDLLHIDFEDGLGSDLVSEGAVVEGPSREGNKFCAIGSIAARQYRIKLRWKERRDVFEYSPTAVLDFDYWLGGQGETASPWGDAVYVQLNTLGRYYIFRTPPPPRKAWAHATLPLGDYYSPKGLPIPRGTGIRDITFESGYALGQPFYVDNIRITDSSADR